MRSCLVFLAACLLAQAADPDQDFSGVWVLDRAASRVEQIAPVADSLNVTQTERIIDYSAGSSRYSIPLDGNERKFQVEGRRWSTASKWEGSALLINSLVIADPDFTVMDRWRLSPDHQSLTIERQILRGQSQSEGRLVYRRPGASPPPAFTPRPTPTPAPSPGKQYVVPAGTHILLSLVSSVNTKHSREGDRVYLETSVPVSIDGRIIIPRGSSVTGTVSNSTRPGKVSGKGELYLRFDQITLPNGVTRDFRSRIGSTDGGNGQLDRTEGSIKGPGNRAGDARTVGTGAGAGATLGGAVGRSAGAAGIGGAAGAVAGLAGVFMKRGPDPSLPRGTQVELILDRDLIYQSNELR